MFLFLCLYALRGTFFRKRYITDSDSFSPVDGAALIPGLSSWQINNDQVTVLTPAAEATVGSAQAFMQAFYPPYTLTSNATAKILDPSSVLASGNNGSYIENPLHGYQYPMIQTYSANDPSLVYLSGESDCLNYDIVAQNYYASDGFKATSASEQGLYDMVGQDILPASLPQDTWSYSNAYNIYDYVSYQKNHNESVNELLATDSWVNVLPTLYELASEKQFALHGNLSVSGAFAGDRILAVSGQTLAAQILGSLSGNMVSKGSSNKFNLLVGDYGPMLALFSLLQLPSHNANFEGIPSFGSALAFELFSWANGTGTTNDDGTNYPSDEELWVRFYFRNSTGDGSTDSSNGVQSYGIFDHGPSDTDLRWAEFESQMNDIMLSDLGDWCAICASSAIWCAAFDTASSNDGAKKKSSDMTPQVAGVIGAGVTIGVLGLLVAAAMLLLGLRFHRRDRKRGAASPLGGFKGSAKLASDADLHIAKHAAPVGVDVKKGHERVGSWEMKGDASPVLGDKAMMDEGRFSTLAGSTVGARSSQGSTGVTRASFEQDDQLHEAEVDRIGLQLPARPDERV